MRVVLLVVLLSSVLLLSAPPVVAPQNPLPGHLVIQNGLSLSNGTCYGSVNTAYGLKSLNLPIRYGLTWNTTTCAISGTISVATTSSFASGSVVTDACFQQTFDVDCQEWGGQNGNAAADVKVTMTACNVVTWSEYAQANGYTDEGSWIDYSCGRLLHQDWGNAPWWIPDATLHLILGTQGANTQCNINGYQWPDNVFTAPSGYYCWVAGGTTGDVNSLPFPAASSISTINSGATLDLTL